MSNSEQQTRQVLAETDLAHPCVFSSVHDHPNFRQYHDDGPTNLVEWLLDELILARGPRSWVCGTQAEVSVALGSCRYATTS